MQKASETSFTGDPLRALGERHQVNGAHLAETGGIRDFPRKVHGAARVVGARLAASHDSAAATWPVLRPWIAAERRFAGRMMARGRLSAAGYEFVRFGVKQAWACLFGGIMLALLIVTHFFYPRTRRSPATISCSSPRSRAGALLAFRLETLGGGEGHLHLPRRRHDHGDLQDRRRLVDLPRAELLPHRRRAAVLRLHVFVHRQLHLPLVDAVPLHVHAPARRYGR